MGNTKITSLKSPPKKITLCCKEIDQFQNEIDSQPSRQLFSIDVDKNNAVHYMQHLNPMSLPLSSSSIHYNLTLAFLDKNYQNVTPKAFNLVLVYNRHVCE